MYLDNYEHKTIHRTEKRIMSKAQSKVKASRRASPGIRKHPEKRKRSKVEHSQSSSATVTLGRDRFGSLTDSSIPGAVQPCFVALNQDVNPLFGKSNIVPWIKRILDVLNSNPDWCDKNDWKEETQPAEVFLKLTGDLKKLLPGKASLDLAPETGAVLCKQEFGSSSCFIDASGFISQMKVHNYKLFELLGATIGKLHRVLKFDLWYSDIEDMALDYLEQMQFEPEAFDLEDKAPAEISYELDRWRNSIIPLQKECLDLADYHTIESLAIAIGEFSWPDTFTAKRIFLWFKKALTLLDHGKPLCWATDYNPYDVEDLEPITPYEAFRFTWQGNKSTEEPNRLADDVESIYNDRFGNGGVIELQTSHDLTQSWKIDTQWLDDLHDFLDASISLWGEPTLHDAFTMSPVATQRIVKKQYGRMIIIFEPVSWKPIPTTI